MLVDLGAHVVTSDRKQVGKVSRVVIDPTTNKVVDLIVQMHGGLLDEAREIVVPMGAVTGATEHEVALGLTEPALLRLANFVDTEYLPPSAGWFSPAQYPPGGVLWPAAVAAPAVVEHENVPEGAVSISEGTDVLCPDGAIGIVDEVVTDTASGHVAGFIVRRGTIFTHDVFIPLDWVAQVTEDEVVLNRTKREVERLKERADNA